MLSKPTLGFDYYLNNNDYQCTHQNVHFDEDFSQEIPKLVLTYISYVNRQRGVVESTETQSLSRFCAIYHYQNHFNHK